MNNFSAVAYIITNWSGFLERFEKRYIDISSLSRSKCLNLIADIIDDEIEAGTLVKNLTVWKIYRDKIRTYAEDIPSHLDMIGPVPGIDKNLTSKKLFSELSYMSIAIQRFNLRGSDVPNRLYDLATGVLFVVKSWIRRHRLVPRVPWIVSDYPYMKQLIKDLIAVRDQLKPGYGPAPTDEAYSRPL